MTIRVADYTRVLAPQTRMSYEIARIFLCATCVFVLDSYRFTRK
jgi:hypothetical protein